ncbi:MAG TPA: sulfatase-like hydrolase/transferase [Vicinamibacterales bacterium]|jgi:hypothetical protein
MRRLHPFLLTALVPLLARVVGLVSYFLASDPAGHPTTPSPISSLVVVLPYHVCVLGGVSAAALLAWNLLPRLRPLVAVAAVALTAVLTFTGETDRQMLRFLGHGFTLATVQTYFNSSMFGDEVLGPLSMDWPHLAMSLTIIALATLLAAWSGWRAVRTARGRQVSWFAVVLFALMPACLTVGLFRDAPRPPELAFAVSIAGFNGMPAPADERQAVEELRALVDAPAGTRWLDPRLPLVRQEPPPPEPPPASAAERPDIVLLVVESLRGHDLGFSSGRTPSVTPNLDALAAHGVAFPRYIANGFSTASSFMTLHTSMWTHRERLLAADLTDVGTDAFPLRLRRLGYETTFVSGSNPNFDNMMLWLRRWYRRLDFEIAGNQWVYTRRMSDRELVDRMIGQIQGHDREAPNTPLLLCAFTAGTHTPYTPEDSYFVPLSAAGDANRVDTRGMTDPQQRYDIVIRNLDAQLLRLTEALNARPRRDRTVLIVVGDHSHFTSEEYPEQLRGMPIDSLEWTGGVIAGPESLVGPPRRVEAVRSHVDLMPTILRLAGDRGPTAAMGKDLLHGEAAPTTIAIREGGIRVDRGGAAVLFEPGRVDHVWAFTPFQQRDTFRPTLDGTPFTRDELTRIDRAVVFWSYLIEKDRVWRSRK